MFSRARAEATDVAALRKQAGKWLRTLREHANLTQRRLADKVGIEVYTVIAQLEAGRGRIQPDHYDAFARALGVEVKPFVKTLLSFYDPMTYKALFGNDVADG